MSNGNLNPVVLIHGISGSKLITKNKLGFPEELWMNLAKIQDAADGESKSGDENINLASRPEVVGDVPEYRIDPSAARTPDPWWKNNMQLDSDGITPTVENGEKFNRPVEGLKAIAKVFADTIPDFYQGKDLRYFKPLIEALKEKGYRDKFGEDQMSILQGNLLGAPYDWRTSPKGLSERYDYFNWLKTQIQELYEINGQKRVVIIAHSMGNRVTQYFLQWIKNSHSGQEGWGQAWLDKYIERYIAVSPPFLGAAMAVRMVATNDPIKLGTIALSDMKQVLQSFASIPWLLPLPVVEREEYFNTESFVFVQRGNDAETQDIVTTLTQAGAENATLKYWEDYKNDPYFSGEELGSKAVECPPVAKLDVIYAPGTPTEVGALYTEIDGELKVKRDEPPQVIGRSLSELTFVNGILVEDSLNTTQKIDGTKNSGDGLVPYASMVYFKEWEKNPPANTTIKGHPIVFADAATVVGHERVLKDQKGIDKILSLLGL